MNTPTCYGQEIPAGFESCEACGLVAACYTAFDSGHPDWHGEIPVDGEVLPAAESAYAWLVASGVPDAEAWRRVWGEVPDSYVGPLVAQIRWQSPTNGNGNVPALRTGPGAFRPGDGVWSVKSRDDRNRRRFNVMGVNPNGSLHLYAMMHGHIYHADPRRWERCKRNEEIAQEIAQCAA